MGLRDLIALVLENIGRRKARVALTAIGVVIGTMAIVILVSLAIGLQQNAESQLYYLGDLRQIHVYPGYQEPEGPVLQSSGPGGTPPGYVPITDQSLAEFAALPGVEVVAPQDGLQAGSLLIYNRLEAYIGLTGIDVEDLSALGWSAQAGTLEIGRGLAVVGAMIPQNFYDPHIRPGQEPPPPPDLLGQTLKLILIKYDEEGGEIRRTVRVRVGGIMAENFRTDYSVFLPLEEVAAYNEWVMGRRINRNSDGYHYVTIQVGDVKHTSAVAEHIKGMGFPVDSPQAIVDELNNFGLVLQILFGGVGAISLIVAAIGIANTMAMAILERTREIGLMKAVGATNRDVLLVFLGEAAGIGFLGGLGGLVFGWSLGQVINVLALVYLAGQGGQQPGIPNVPTTIAVVTPMWLLGFALVFATLVGLFSGIYPALRAATLVPVRALKYE